MIVVSVNYLNLTSVSNIGSNVGANCQHHSSNMRSQIIVLPTLEPKPIWLDAGHLERADLEDIRGTATALTVIVRTLKAICGACVRFINQSIPTALVIN